MKVKLTHSQYEALSYIIDEQVRLMKRSIDFSDDKDMDMLLIATLEEMHRKVNVQMIAMQKSYSFKLKPTWGFALRILYAGNIDTTTHIGNTLMMLCNKIDQQFQILNTEP